MTKLNKTLLFINLFLLQSYLIRFSIGGYPSNLQEVLIGANCVTMFFTWVAERRWPRFREHWVVYSFLGLSIFSVIFNGILEPALSQIDLFRHLKFLVFACAMVVIFLETLSSGQERLRGIRIDGYGALAFGIFSAIYNLAGFNVTHDYRLLGPLDAAVYLGYYLAPFFIFFSVSWLDRRTPSDLICAVILGLLLLATRSMGSLAASVAILCFYLWKSRGSALSSRTKKLIVAVLVLLSMAVFYTKILPTIQTEYSSLDERGEIWSTAWELTKTPGVWLHGLGLSQFEAHYIATADEVLGRPPLDYHVIQPHNIFFLFLFHYGALGLVLLGFLAWKTTSVLFKKIDHKTIDPEVIAALLAFYFFIHGLIDTPIYKNDLLILFILFLSLTPAPSPTPSKHHKDLPLS